MKQISSFLGSLLVTAIWAGILYLTGAFSFVERHVDLIILSGRVAVVALGPFTLIAMLFIVDGNARPLAEKLLALLFGIASLAMIAAKATGRIPLAFLRFFAAWSVYMFVWLPLLAWGATYAS